MSDVMRRELVTVGIDVITLELGKSLPLPAREELTRQDW